MSLHDGFGTFTCDHRGLIELFHVRTCKAMALPSVRAAKRTQKKTIRDVVCTDLPIERFFRYGVTSLLSCFGV